jgi:uncharacterized membrane protein
MIGSDELLLVLLGLIEKKRREKKNMIRVI